MKTLLRTSALAAALALTALAASHAIVTNGTCRTFCFDPATHTLTQVSWYTTESQCCSGSVNPCPPGTNPGSSSFQPPGGFARLCPIN